MSDSTRRLDYGLLQAIKFEHDGHLFYLTAASNTEDPQGREVFETLAAEELDHMRFLKAQYDSLKETGRVSPKVHLGSRMKLDLLGDSPIFSPEIKMRLGDADYEMSALSIGIMLERRTLNLYEREGAAAVDPEVAEFYSTLARWEQGHLDALIRQEEALKEDYWHQSDLYPS